MERSAKRLLAQGITEYPITGSGHSIAGLRPGHVVACRDARKTTILDLYRNGKLTDVTVAVRAGAKDKDHAEAIRHGLDPAKVFAAGVSLGKVKASDAKVRSSGETAKAKAKAVAAAPKMMMAIVKNGHAAKVVMAEKTVKVESAFVQECMARDKRMIEHKKAVAAKGLNGFAPTLSEAEKAALVARSMGKKYYE